MTHHAQSIPLSAGTTAVIEALEQAGYTAWAVGGCVRDALLGRAVHDFDIATNAHWQQVQSIVQQAGMRTYPTGVAHGTLSVVCGKEALEVTTYRTEGSYSDARHPDSVVFVDTIEEDLARRDFTINAMAYHPTRGLCDPYGGQADLARGVLRAVGDARTRMSEDALRILRAVRFASELGFAIDPATLDGMHATIGRLDKVAAERIAAEMDRLLCGANVRSVLLGYPIIIDAVVPELSALRGLDQKSPYHIYDAMEHTAYVVDYSPAQPLARWSALLHDIGKPDAFFVDETGQGHFYGHPRLGVPKAEAVLQRLKYSPRFIHEVALLVRYHDAVIAPNKHSVKKMVRRLDERPDLFYALCSLQRADSLAHAPLHQRFVHTAPQLQQLMDEILAEHEPFSLKDLALGGNDIVARGIKPGPRVGALLNQALEGVIEGQVQNETTALLRFLGI